MLSRNEWGGISELPEIIAAFIQPNAPFVQEILRRAAKILEANGRSPILDGYQSKNRQKVGEQVNAIWSATVKQDLAYVEPLGGCPRTQSEQLETQYMVFSLN